jgi:hypothetical protein
MRPAIPLVLALLVGCAIDYGNGEPASEVREIDGFSSVRNTTLVDVFVTVGEEYYVEVRCDENLIDCIETVERSGDLVVETPRNVIIRPRTNCTVSVELPALYELSSSGSGDTEAAGVLTDLESVSASGSGEVYVDDIDTALLDLHCSGSGTIHARGAAEHTTLHSSGSGGIDARDLVTRDADITCTGSGDIEVTATGTVDVHMSGSGDVVLYGDPEDVDVSDSGSGDVIRY